MHRNEIKPRISTCKLPRRRAGEANTSAFIRVITYNLPTASGAAASLVRSSNKHPKAATTYSKVCIAFRMHCAARWKLPVPPFRPRSIVVNYHRCSRADALTRLCLRVSSLSDCHRLLCSSAKGGVARVSAHFGDAADRTEVPCCL